MLRPPNRRRIALVLFVWISAFAFFVWPFGTTILWFHDAATTSATNSRQSTSDSPLDPSADEAQRHSIVIPAAKPSSSRSPRRNIMPTSNRSRGVAHRLNEEPARWPTVATSSSTVRRHPYASLPRFPKRRRRPPPPRMLRSQVCVDLLCPSREIASFAFQMTNHNDTQSFQDCVAEWRGPRGRRPDQATRKAIVVASPGSLSRCSSKDKHASTRDSVEGCVDPAVPLISVPVSLTRLSDGPWMLCYAEGDTVCASLRRSGEWEHFLVRWLWDAMATVRDEAKADRDVYRDALLAYVASRAAGNSSGVGSNGSDTTVAEGTDNHVHVARVDDPIVPPLSLRDESRQTTTLRQLLQHWSDRIDDSVEQAENGAAVGTATRRRRSGTGGDDGALMNPTMPWRSSTREEASQAVTFLDIGGNVGAFALAMHRLPPKHLASTTDGASAAAVLRAAKYRRPGAGAQASLEETSPAPIAGVPVIVFEAMPWNAQLLSTSKCLNGWRGELWSDKLSLWAAPQEGEAQMETDDMSARSLGAGHDVRSESDDGSRRAAVSPPPQQLRAALADRDRSVLSGGAVLDPDEFALLQRHATVPRASDMEAASSELTIVHAALGSPPPPSADDDTETTTPQGNAKDEHLSGVPANKHAHVNPSAAWVYDAHAMDDARDSRRTSPVVREGRWCVMISTDVNKGDVILKCEEDRKGSGGEAPPTTLSPPAAGSPASPPYVVRGKVGIHTLDAFMRRKRHHSLWRMNLLLGIIRDAVVTAASSASPQFGTRLLDDPRAPLPPTSLWMQDYVVKMDVEGHEFHVARGATWFFSRNSPFRPKVILSEVWSSLAIIDYVEHMRLVGGYLCFTWTSRKWLLTRKATEAFHDHMKSHKRPLDTIVFVAGMSLVETLSGLRLPQDIVPDWFS